MKLIKPYYEILEQDYTLKDIFKHVEKIGRVCYKSEDKITETSADYFVSRMVKSKHLSMLEHGTVYLTISIPKKAWNKEIVDKYYNNKYSKVNNIYDDFNYTYFITTNLRVIVENEWEDDLKYICESTENHYKRTTVKFICDIGVQREFCRHRVFSMANESTRYCNYSKSKFNNELTFIKPCWLKTNIEEVDTTRLSYKLPFYHQALANAERSYFKLINSGWKPEQARCVLPLSLKSELVLTGFNEDWKHFFDLRSIGTTGKPHPQAEELATPLYKEFIKRKYIEQ